MELKELINEGRMICFDMDGVIAVGTYNDTATPLEKEPNKELIIEMQRLYDNGWTIHIYTSRPYQMLDATIRWLKKHKVPYHMIDFNKPLADFYVDDRWLRPSLVKHLDKEEWCGPVVERKRLKIKEMEQFRRKREALFKRR